MGSVSSLWQTALDVFFPRKCLECGSCFYDDPDRAKQEAAAGNELTPFFCRHCFQPVKPLRSPFCAVCGMPFDVARTFSDSCPDCRKTSPGFSKARAAGIYEGLLARAIGCFKYNGFVGLAAPLARMLEITCARYWATDAFDGLVPVPLSRKRLQQRGFNQALLLLYAWQRIAREKASDLPPVWASVLRRARHIPPQTRLSSMAERHANVANAFAVIDQKKIHRKRILLVDDVMTSGATANACTKALRTAGAVRVDVLTLARTAYNRKDID